MKSILTLTLFAACAGSAQPTLRIGTVHPAASLVAHHNSAAWNAALAGKLAELKAAKAAGDTKKVEELEKWGATRQELAHKMLAGEAPYTQLIEYLQPFLPQVASRAGVSAVVLELPFAAPGVEVVDVTDALLDVLQVDTRVRKMCQDLRQRSGPLRVH